MARKMPSGRVGNYRAPVDTVGMDEPMKALLTGTKMNKTESGYTKGRGASAKEAVRRARKANKQPLLKEED